MTNTTTKTTPSAPGSLVSPKDSQKATKRQTEHSMAFKQILPHFKHVHVCKSSKPLLLKPLVVSQYFFFEWLCLYKINMYETKLLACLLGIIIKLACSNLHLWVLKTYHSESPGETKVWHVKHGLDHVRGLWFS